MAVTEPGNVHARVSMHDNQPAGRFSMFVSMRALSNVYV